MNSRTKKLNQARDRFISKHKKGNKIPCVICHEPGVWAHLVGRNVPFKWNDPTKDGMAIGLCPRHHAEYDRETSLPKRMEFWERHNFFSLAQKLFNLQQEVSDESTN